MKAIFPVPRMGRADVEKRPLTKVAIGFLVILGLGLSGLVVVAHQYQGDRLVTSDDASGSAESQASASQGILTGFSLSAKETPGAAPRSRRATSRSATAVRATPTFPSTQKVLDLLDGLLVTYQYTPYFIIYNREVDMLQKALRDLAASSERSLLTGPLLRYIDEASYAHTKLREAWRIKTNPLKTAQDVATYLRSVRVSVAVPRDAFRSLPAGAKKSTYEMAAKNLIAGATGFTESAREEFTKIRSTPNRIQRRSGTQIHDGGMWGN